MYFVDMRLKVKDYTCEKSYMQNVLEKKPKTQKSVTQSLKKYIDYCISHTAPTFIVRQFGYDPTVNDDRWLVDYLYEDVYKKCGNNLTCWFFGHFHEDLVMWGGMFRALLNDVVKIE